MRKNEKECSLISHIFRDLRLRAVVTDKTQTAFSHPVKCIWNLVRCIQRFISLQYTIAWSSLKKTFAYKLTIGEYTFSRKMIDGLYWPYKYVLHKTTEMFLRAFFEGSL